MNKVIEVNEEFSYALVEPGVTFTDLYDHCVLHKLSVWPSVPSLGWGSVVGNVGSRSRSICCSANQGYIIRLWTEELDFFLRLLIISILLVLRSSLLMATSSGRVNMVSRVRHQLIYPNSRLVHPSKDFSCKAILA